MGTSTESANYWISWQNHWLIEPPQKKSSISSRNLWKIGQKATQLNMNCQIFTYFICLFRKNKSFIDHNRAVLTPNNLIKWQIILKRKATDSWMPKSPHIFHLAKCLKGKFKRCIFMTYDFFFSLLSCLKNLSKVMTSRKVKCIFSNFFNSSSYFLLLSSSGRFFNFVCFPI